MVYLAAALTVISFAVAFELMRIAPRAAKAITVSREAVATFRDRSLTDDDKEKMLQGASLTLMGIFVSILVRGAAAVGISMVSPIVLDAMDLAPVSDVTGLLMDWKVIAAVSVGMAAYYLVPRKH